MEHDLLAQKRTAYALGELDATERAVLEADVLKSEAHRLEVEEIRALAAALAGALANEKTPGMLEIQHLAIESTLQQLTEDHEASARARLRRQRITFWVPTALAACALVASGVALLLLTRQGGIAIESPTSPVEKVANSAGPGTGLAKPRINDLIIEYNDIASINPPHGAPAVYGPYVNNVVVDADSLVAFHPVAVTPLSGFPLTVDTSTVPFVQRFIQRGVLPPRGTVHVEAMINAYAYEDVKQIKQDAPLAVKTEVSDCPWNSGHRLARVLVKAKDGSSGEIVAEDVRVRVEFNPARVASYRLIGYENRLPVSGVDHSEDRANLSAGHTLTALYEIVPVGSFQEPTGPARDQLRYQKIAQLTSTAENANELFNVKLSFRTDANLLEQSVEASAVEAGTGLAKASSDFRFAAAVAQFGLVLLDPPANSRATLEAIHALALEARGTDASGDRLRFLQIVVDAQRIVVN
jgi:anti-sigma-K factor RskA